MTSSFRFAIVSDPHIALPQTIWNHPSRFHLVEVSIPALEQVLTELAQLELDFLLLPGDLTQHGEPENHEWLVNRLAQLPYPVYVVPGNHDIPQEKAGDRAIGLAEFPHYYRQFGYAETRAAFYRCEVVPGVTLLGLNSIAFNAQGEQLEMGRLDDAQLHWLDETLAQVGDHLVLVMLHHNVLEHLPGQTHHGMGRRYMLENAPDLLARLHRANVPLIFTGHLHVQDIAHQAGLYEITTGSLVSYPHPYRILTLTTDEQGHQHLTVETGRIQAVSGWEDLQYQSREWMGDRSHHFMYRFLTLPPLSIAPDEAKALVADLRYFWADIAEGDAVFDFSHFPARARRYLHQFNAVDSQGNPIQMDNHTTLTLRRAPHRAIH